MIIESFKAICVATGEKVGYPVNYIFGESAYIREQLSVLSKSRETALKKFPLIGLYSPFVERKDSRDYYCKTSVDLIIAVNTLEKYTNEQRLEVSFKGVLRPLYEAFIEEVKNYKRFDFDDHVSHNYSENFVFGRRGAYDSLGNELSEKIDAIEIKNLELTVKKEKCYGKRIF